MSRPASSSLSWPRRLLVLLAMLFAAIAAFWFTRTPVPEPLWVGPEGYDWAQPFHVSALIELVGSSREQFTLCKVDPRSGTALCERQYSLFPRGLIHTKPDLRAFLTHGFPGVHSGFVDILDDASDRQVCRIPLLWPEYHRRLGARLLNVAVGRKLVQRNQENWLISCERLRVFDVCTGRLEMDRSFPCHSTAQDTGHTECSPDGRWLAVSDRLNATAQSRNRVRLIDLAAQRVVHELNDYYLSATYHHWSADSKLLACDKWEPEQEASFNLWSIDQARFASTTFLYKPGPNGGRQPVVIEAMDWDARSERLLLAESTRTLESRPHWLPEWLWDRIRSATQNYSLHDLRTGNRRLLAVCKGGRIEAARFTPVGNGILLRDYRKTGPTVLCYALPGNYVWPTGWRVAIILTAAALAGLLSRRLLQERRAAARRAGGDAPLVPPAG